jgi:hypothetical protein
MEILSGFLICQTGSEMMKLTGILMVLVNFGTTT